MIFAQIAFENLSVIGEAPRYGSLAKFILPLSQKGAPLLLEYGGGRTNTGEAIVIATAGGKKPQAVWVALHGHRANRAHAAFYARPWMFIAVASHHRGKFKIALWQIASVQSECALPGYGLAAAHLVEVYTEPRPAVPGWREGTISLIESGWMWDAHRDAAKRSVVEAVVSKALHYHCRQPHHAAFGKVTQALNKSWTRLECPAVGQTTVVFEE